MPIEEPSADRRPNREPKGKAVESLRRRANTDGVEALGVVELVALLIASDAKQPPALQAAALLSEVSQGLDSWRPFSPRAVAEITGVSEQAAARLLAALELGTRVHQASLQTKPLALTPEGVFRWARPKLTALRHEEVWALCLDGGGRLMSSVQVGRGGVGNASVLPRDILGPVLRQSAAGFVLVHNHPSGDPTPSPEDRAMTDALARAAALCGTPLVDHIVVGRYGYVSLMNS